MLIAAIPLSHLEIEGISRSLKRQGLIECSKRLEEAYRRHTSVIRFADLSEVRAYMDGLSRVLAQRRANWEE